MSGKLPVSFQSRARHTHISLEADIHTLKFRNREEESTMTTQGEYVPLIEKIDGYKTIEVTQDEEHPSCAPEGDVSILYTTGLYTCIGIAISGVYPPASDKRYHRFMIHTSEGQAEKNYQALREKVEAAKTNGLQDLNAHVMAVDPAGALIKEIQPWLKSELGKLVVSIHWYTYPNLPEHAAMALFDDGTFIAESQESDGDHIEQVREKRQVSTLPTGVTSSDGNSSKS